MSAPFEFMGYQIQSLNYKFDDTQPLRAKEQKVNLEVRLDRNNDDPMMFRLNLHIRVESNPSIELFINGFFKWVIDYVAGDAEYSLHTSGATILYPYARMAISTLSILDGGEPLLIQTMNFYELISKDQILEQTQKDPIPT